MTVLSFDTDLLSIKLPVLQSILLAAGRYKVPWLSLSEGQQFSSILTAPASISHSLCSVCNRLPSFPDGFL